MTHPFDRAHYSDPEKLEQAKREWSRVYDSARYRWDREHLRRGRLRELGPPILAAVLSLVVTWWLLGWVMK